MNRGKEREDIYDISQLCNFLHIHYIVTVHQNDLKPLAKIFQQYNDDWGYNDNIVTKYGVAIVANMKKIKKSIILVVMTI